MKYQLILAGLLSCLLWQAQAGFLSKDKANPFPEGQDFPAAEDAFKAEAPVWDGDTLTIGWHVAPGCYLYRDRIKIKVLEPENLELSLVGTGPADEIDDPHFGKSAIFRKQAEMRYSSKDGRMPERLEVRFQGCAEDRVCYPPQKLELVVVRK